MILLFLLLQQEPKKDCPLSEVKSELYCDTCKKVLEEEMILDKTFCKKCCDGTKERVKARTVEVCVRTYYVAACHPEQTSLTPALHCGKDMEKKVSKACVVYRCDECAKTRDAPGDCCRKRLRVVCSLSGEFPHTTR